MTETDMRFSMRWIKKIFTVIFTAGSCRGYKKEKLGTY
jgi:hypothetical protein